MAVLKVCIFSLIVTTQIWTWQNFTGYENHLTGTLMKHRKGLPQATNLKKKYKK